MGNGPGATGIMMLQDHPTKNLQQFELYRQMGELRYSAWRGELARQAIRADLPRFFRLCLTRIYYFWFGIPNEEFSLLVNFGRGLNYGFTSLAGLLGLALALRRRLPAAGLLAAAFLLLPASGTLWSRSLPCSASSFFSRRNRAGDARCRACGGSGRRRQAAPCLMQIDLYPANPVHYSSLAIPACGRGARRSPSHFVT